MKNYRFFLYTCKTNLYKVFKKNTTAYYPPAPYKYKKGTQTLPNLTSCYKKPERSLYKGCLGMQWKRTRCLVRLSLWLPLQQIKLGNTSKLFFQKGIELHENVSFTSPWNWPKRDQKLFKHDSGKSLNKPWSKREGTTLVLWQIKINSRKESSYHLNNKVTLWSKFNPMLWPHLYKHYKFVVITS